VVVGAEADDAKGGLVVFHISSMAGFGANVKRFRGAVTILYNRPWRVVHSNYSDLNYQLR